MLIIVRICEIWLAGTDTGLSIILCTALQDQPPGSSGFARQKNSVHVRYGKTFVIPASTGLILKLPTSFPFVWGKDGENKSPFVCCICLLVVGDRLLAPRAALGLLILLFRWPVCSLRWAQLSRICEMSIRTNLPLGNANKGKEGLDILSILFKAQIPS